MAIVGFLFCFVIVFLCCCFVIAFLCYGGFVKDGTGSPLPAWLARSFREQCAQRSAASEQWDPEYVVRGAYTSRAMLND